MSSVPEEPAHVERLGLSLRGNPVLSQPATLEVRQGRRIVRILTPTVKLEFMGDAYEQFMEKLMPLRSPQEKVSGLEVVISIPHLRHVLSAQSLSLTQVSDAWSITTSIEILQG